ncbi:hypothetical protein RJ639_024717 [Escallonia herrerae]|uniref:ubiquitinyl hydrolase 1 n=1 Tax=Escallonia herrerae TaxID=1293975 RepID=A0AA88UXD5_9ASTE|nr:hypothetical protein RJ639_024717 [Escallonia herrerae]
MQNQEELPLDAEVESMTSVKVSEADNWANFKDDDIMQQQSAIWAKEAEKLPFVGDKEPLSSLATEYQSGSPILLEKIKVLSEKYDGIRRTRGDGNCFFRSFMFSYLLLKSLLGCQIKEHILVSQDREEVDRITTNVEKCKKTLQSLGYAEFTFEDFFALFLEQLESVMEENEASISHDELLQRSRDQSVSDYEKAVLKSDVYLLTYFIGLVVMFFRFVTSGEIRKRAEFFEPFILGLTNATVEQFCKSAVEPMGEESDHVHITALSDALGVPIRVIYLDRSSCDAGGVSVNHHDFIPASGDLPSVTGGVPETISPFINLLYRPGHYDILYPK